MLNFGNRRMIYVDKIDMEAEFQFMAYTSIGAWKQLCESKGPLNSHHKNYHSFFTQNMPFNQLFYRKQARKQYNKDVSLGNFMEILCKSGKMSNLVLRKISCNSYKLETHKTHTRTHITCARIAKVQF